jgi:Skp family chaperone for outer membrane proteins
VKRTISYLMAGALFGAVVSVGSHVWAQQGAPAPARPPLQSKIAVVNIGQVIKNYLKFKMYNENIKREFEPIQKELEAKKAQVTQLQAQLAKPEITPQQREQMEHQVKQLQRELQDGSDEYQQKFVKKRMDEMVTLYRDVQNAVTQYARYNAFELVLQYNDGVEQGEKTSPVSLQQKLGNQACIPIYNDERMEITGVITDMLNRQFQTTSTAPAPGTAPATPAAPGAANHR